MATNAVIATITVASDATSVTKAMVRNSTWRAGTSGVWNNGSCTLNADSVYQFRTPVPMPLQFEAILPNIKADVTIAWDDTAPTISDLGNGFMVSYAYECDKLIYLAVPDISDIVSIPLYGFYNYAFGCTGLKTLEIPNTYSVTSVGSLFMQSYATNCTGLTSLILPENPGYFATTPVSWGIPSTRLNQLKGITPSQASAIQWRLLTTTPQTLFLNYIRSAANVIFTSSALPAGVFKDGTFRHFTGLCTFENDVKRTLNHACTFENDVKRTLF